LQWGTEKVQQAPEEAVVLHQLSFDKLKLEFLHTTNARVSGLANAPALHLNSKLEFRNAQSGKI
jgi:hypothetical protein